MIEFPSNESRESFHLLPLDQQRLIMQLGERLRAQCEVSLLICDVIRFNGNESEITLRIDKKLD